MLIPSSRFDSLSFYLPFPFSPFVLILSLSWTLYWFPVLSVPSESLPPARNGLSSHREISTRLWGFSSSGIRKVFV
jgi:hypothetical protein